MHYQRLLVLFVTLIFALFISGCGTSSRSSDSYPEEDTGSEPAMPTIQETRYAVVNNVQLDEETLIVLEQQYALRIEDGEYWYDPILGAWGFQGGPTVGFTWPNLALGGPLAPDASEGYTGVFLNGRELDQQDLINLAQILGPLPYGRYWLDAQGYYGYEGGGALGNMIYLAQEANLSNQNGSGGYSRSTYGGYIASDGQTSGFFDPESGCSVLSDGGGVSC